MFVQFETKILITSQLSQKVQIFPFQIFIIQIKHAYVTFLLTWKNNHFITIPRKKDCLYSCSPEKRVVWIVIKYHFYSYFRHSIHIEKGTSWQAKSREKITFVSPSRWKAIAPCHSVHFRRKDGKKPSNFQTDLVMVVNWKSSMEEDTFNFILAFGICWRDYCLGTQLS